MQDGLTDEQQEHVGDTQVYTSMINRYFTPALIAELGYMDFISVTENKYYLNHQQQINEVMNVLQNAIDWYDFPVIDTSQISIIDFAHHYFDYKVDTMQANNFLNYVNTNDPVFQSQIYQSRKQVNLVWSINSFDLILGLVGGFTAILWAISGFLIAPYEEFKFQNSLAGCVYPTSPQRDEDEPPISSRNEATVHLDGTIK